jgi:hypothetical protein
MVLAIRMYKCLTFLTAIRPYHVASAGCSFTLLSGANKSLSILGKLRISRHELCQPEKCCKPKSKRAQKVQQEAEGKTNIPRIRFLQRAQY